MTLELPRQPWFWQDRRERTVLHPTPGPVDPAVFERFKKRELLAAQQEQSLDEALVRKCAPLAAAHQKALTALRVVEDELATLQGDADDLDVEQLIERDARRERLEATKIVLERRMLATGVAFSAATEAVRAELLRQARLPGGVVATLRSEIGDLLEQQEQIERAIVEKRLLASDVESAFGRWQPPQTGDDDG